MWLASGRCPGGRGIGRCRRAGYGQVPAVHDAASLHGGAGVRALPQRPEARAHREGARRLAPGRIASGTEPRLTVGSKGESDYRGAPLVPPELMTAAVAESVDKGILIFAHPGGGAGIDTLLDGRRARLQDGLRGPLAPGEGDARADDTAEDTAPRLALGLVGHGVAAPARRAAAIRMVVPRYRQLGSVRARRRGRVRRHGGRNAVAPLRSRLAAGPTGL